MIETLGPNMARTIVGDAYDPDYKYELETDDEGFHLIVTNKTTGESKYLNLNESEKEEDTRAPLWDEERLERESKRSKLSFYLLLISGIVFTLSIMALVYLSVR